MTTSTARQGTLVKKQERSAVAETTASGTGTKDDEEGNV